MKSDLEKRLEYVRSQRKVLQRTEKQLQKQLEAEKSEFDFKAKMPVGSVWLGTHKVIEHDKIYGVAYQRLVSLKESDKATYHAHKIVKAAQEWENNTDFSKIMLSISLENAKRARVLQNLE